MYPEEVVACGAKQPQREKLGSFRRDLAVCMHACSCLLSCSVTTGDQQTLPFWGATVQVIALHAFHKRRPIYSNLHWHGSKPMAQMPSRSDHAAFEASTAR